MTSNRTLSRRSFLAAAALAAPRLGAAPAPPRPPNFVVLFADDMGYGDLACYGHPTLRTPRLDRMAAEGVRFTSFYAAAPFCTPSRAGLLTGRYPIRAGQANNLGPDSKGGLPLGEITLAQALKQRGYRTMCIGKWHLGHDPAAYLPTSRGFDHYLGLLYSNDMIPPWVQTNRPLHLFRDSEPVELMTDQSDLTERYTNEAVRFIRSAGNDPFFLYLPYAMPHLPISASSRRGTSRAGLYGDVIETLDWSAGEILDTLKRQGLDEHTLVVFTSDNGPWLNLPPRMLQKGVEPWHAGSKGLLRGSKGDTYEGGMRVPCIARWPGAIPAGQTSFEIGCTLDLFPTILEAAGVPVPTGLDGRSVFASDRRQEIYLQSALHPETGGERPLPGRAVVTADWKYSVWADGRWREHLVHLAHDPGEMVNLAVCDQYRDRLHELRHRLEACRRSEERRVGKECRSRWSPYH